MRAGHPEDLTAVVSANYKSLRNNGLIARSLRARFPCWTITTKISPDDLRVRKRSRLGPPFRSSLPVC
jgi:hypothetical protein